MTPNKKVIIMFLFGFVLVIGAVISSALFFGAPDAQAQIERYVVRKDMTTGEVISDLLTKGYIKNSLAFTVALRTKSKTNTILPGGYKISKAMSAWELAGVFSGESYMKWVTIPEGLRKEEIADIMARELGWSNEEKREWLTVHTVPSPEYREGVYFPDTYLIPVDEPIGDVAKRLRRRFDEVFEPFAKEALKQNIKWDTALKIASLVQREAAGKSDMPLVAGIIWNRLLIDMKLDIDAALQYARGDAGKGYWAPLSPEDKNIDSPYNLYKYKGVPPTPIANPGLDAIKSVFFPQPTECLYYLHAKDKKIYCAKTFEEHKENIEKHLK